MKITYDSEEDILRIQFISTQQDDDEKENQEIVIDYDESGNISSMEIRNASQKIKNITKFKNKGMDEKIPFQERVYPQDFWKSYTLDELAAMQKVKPVTDLSKIIGTWPGEIDDGFEKEILKIRHSNIIGG